jgi:DHA2 family multidrug resistance protein
MFVLRELWTPRPFLNIRLIVQEDLPVLLALLSGFRFIILSTAYIIPTYLQTVQNFRELQIRAVLLWIALPQFILVLTGIYVGRILKARSPPSCR